MMIPEKREKASFVTDFPVKTGYINVITPRAYQNKGELKYTGEFLFLPASPDFERLKAIAVEIARKQWPGVNLHEAHKAGQMRMPWSVGDRQIENRRAQRAAEGKEYDGSLDYKKGFMVVTASTAKAPPALGFVDARGVITDIPADIIERHAAKFYSGTDVLVSLSVRSYGDFGGDPGKPIPGVTCFLQQVATFNRGEQIGGRKPSQTFSAYKGRASAIDPRRQDPDDIPF